MSSASKSKGEALKKYRAEILMIKPYEFVDRWPKRPDENDALEAFTHTREFTFSSCDASFQVHVFRIMMTIMPVRDRQMIAP